MAAAGASADAEYTVLTAAQKTRFDASGYLVLKGFLDRDARGRLEEEVDALATRRAAGERPSVVHSRALALLTSHPRMIAIVGQLMGCRAFAMHHIHAARHDAGLPGVPWHQDYEQFPQSNRSHLMVHVFYYTDGLNGDIGDLLVVPGSQRSVVEGGALTLFGTNDLPGSVTVDRLAPGSAIVVHSALFHARRAKPGGEGRRRYFIDVSYCQNGVLWPGYPGVAEINAKLLAMGADRDGRYPWLFETARFFDRRSAAKRIRKVKGSIVAPGR